VAYDLLSKRERKPRHLAIAAHLRRAFAGDGEEVAEVIAAHLLDAYRAAGGDPDEDELRVAALDGLRRAAQRATSIGAPEAAERSLLTALELAVNDAERAELGEKAADAALHAGRYDAALRHYQAAAERHAAAGGTRDAARLAAGVGRALSFLGRNQEAVERLTVALEALGPDAEDPDAAVLSTELGVALFFAGRYDEAEPPLERGLVLAQTLDLPELTAYAMHRTALLRTIQGRVEEARSLFDGAVRFAERLGRSDDLLTAQLNRGDLHQRFDLPGALEHTLESLATARRLGNASFESVAASNAMTRWVLAGRWDEIDRLCAELDAAGPARPDIEYVHLVPVEVATLRGDVAAAQAHVAHLAGWEARDSNEARLMHAVTSSLVATHDPAERDAALERLAQALRATTRLEGPAAEPTRLAWAQTIDAALDAGRADLAAELVALFDDVPPGRVPPYIRAQRLRCGARLAAARGARDGVEDGFRAAIDRLDDLGFVYWAARARAELGAWLVGEGRADEAAPLLDAAEATFVPLGAQPALAALRAARARTPVQA
jgi:tetratricopeptide (TPR) repeat protein